ncbi:uncharacterized protein N7487_003307 [Penicillium crustosum]|nr:uncharacterized protein N7487_003307 [Penicillium crustosum]KAJ5419757.1 hypothetical protein N7487_003307 [Penicillium crustosum]
MPQNLRHEKKAQDPGLRTRFKAKFHWRRAKAESIAPGVPVIETTNHTNDGDQNKVSTMPNGKIILDDQKQLTEEVAGVPERIPQMALVVDDAHNDDAKMKPKNLWDEAFLSLSPDEQAHLKAILGDGQVSSMFTKPDFASLKVDVQRKQDQCEEKSWKLSFGDHVIVVKDFAAKSATWLQKLGDLVIPFAPTAASAPWGLIKGVLQIPISYDHQMLALLGTMDEVFKVVYHGQIYEMLYTPERTRDDVLQTLQTELHGIYKSALELIAYTQKQLSGGTLKNIVEAIASPDSADGLLSTLKARHVGLSHAAQLCESWRSGEVDDRLLDGLRAISEPMVRFEENFQTYFDEMESAKMIQILEAISSIPYTTHHQEYQEKRTTDTCNWLLEDEGFRAWESSRSSGAFWLWGTAGTGKSFLTSKVIDHLQENLEGTPNHERLAFFYCRRTQGEEERSRPLSVLQSFLRQLACHLDKPELMQSGLVEAFDKVQKHKGSFNRSICEPLLEESFKIYPCTTLVIDALDECDSASRDELIEFLGRVIPGASMRVKIFISSRPDDDIKRKFGTGQNIGVLSDRSRGDMRLFIDQRLQSMMKTNHAIEKSKNKISERLFSKCDGITQESIEARLNSLPSGLKKAYDEIYARIKEQDELAQQLVDRAVMWIMCAARPLTSNEILSAIRVDTKEQDLQTSSEINEEDLLFFCQHLLVIDHKGIWRVSHLSVMEYFEQQYWTLQEAHINVGNACLLVLLDMPEPNGDLESDEETEHSKETTTTNMSRALSLHVDFQQYVQWHWVIHVQAQNKSQISQTSSMKELLVKFLGSPTRSSIWYRFWHQRILLHSERAVGYQIPLTSPLSRYGMLETISPPEFPMLAVCKLGIYAALGEWWDNLDGCLEQVNSMGLGLIQLATEANCTPICDLLLDAGAPVDMQSQGNSLSTAIDNRNLELVQLLHTKNRCDWNWLIQHDTFQYMLYDAFKNSDCRIGQFFAADDRLDVNIHIEHHGSLLEATVDANNPMMAELLIDRGADVNLAHESALWGSVLAKAAVCSNLDMLKCLHRRGADIDLLLRSGGYGSALTAATASSYNDPDIIKYLVDCGANVNLKSKCGIHGSALAFAASSWECRDAVKYLVGSGADINLLLECGMYGSALAAATASTSINGTTENLEYLVENGADVNLLLEGGDYGSALAAAVSRDDMPAIKCLVDFGADINLLLCCGEYGSALAAAAASPWADLDLLEYLMDCGADVNLILKCGKYGSALAAAAASSWESLDIVRYLVDQGAEINIPLNYGVFGSALAAAAYFGNKECVEFLISKGALVDLKVNQDRFSNAVEAAEAEPLIEELDLWNSTFGLESRVAKRVEVSKFLRSLLDTQSS